MSSNPDTLELGKRETDGAPKGDPEKAQSGERAKEQ